MFKTIFLTKKVQPKELSKTPISVLLEAKYGRPKEKIPTYSVP